MRKVVLASVAAALAGGLALPVAARTQIDFFVDVGPPVAYYGVPDPFPARVWVPGYWEWRHGHRVWIDGHWTRHRHYGGPARWHHRHDHRDRYRAGWRDWDRDGVPNRYDRAPRNPRWY